LVAGDFFRRHVPVCDIACFHESARELCWQVGCRSTTSLRIDSTCMIG
jgi:hypothetical protein